MSFFGALMGTIGGWESPGVELGAQEGERGYLGVTELPARFAREGRRRTKC